MIFSKISQVRVRSRGVFLCWAQFSMVSRKRVLENKTKIDSRARSTKISPSAIQLLRNSLKGLFQKKNKSYEDKYKKVEMSLIDAKYNPIFCIFQWNMNLFVFSLSQKDIWKSHFSTLVKYAISNKLKKKCFLKLFFWHITKKKVKL